LGWHFWFCKDISCRTDFRYDMENFVTELKEEHRPYDEELEEMRRYALGYFQTRCPD